MRKEQVEELVTILLRDLLKDSENLASQAVDAAHIIARIISTPIIWNA